MKYDDAPGTLSSAAEMRPPVVDSATAIFSRRCFSITAIFSASGNRFCMWASSQSGIGSMLSRGVSVEEDRGDDIDRAIGRRVLAAVAVDAAHHPEQRLGGDPGVEAGLPRRSEERRAGEECR